MKAHTTFIALIAALVASPVIARDIKAEQLADLELYKQVAGSPLDRLDRSLLSGNSWEPLGDQYLLFKTHPNKPYLLTMKEDCQGLSHAMAVTFDGGKTLHAGMSYAKVAGPENPAGLECKIEQIQPVDLKAYRELKKAAKVAAQK